MEKLDGKYATMFKTLEDMKKDERAFDKYRRMILRQPGLHAHKDPPGHIGASTIGHQWSSTSLAKAG